MENIEKELQELVGKEFDEDIFLDLHMITAPLLKEDDAAYLNFKASECVIEADENGNQQIKVLTKYCFETEFSDLCIEICTEKIFNRASDSADSVLEKIYSVYMY